MNNKINVCIGITKQDKDIVEWLNMLAKEKMSVRTWVQALLLTELAGVPIDAGGVCIPNRKRPDDHKASLMFGDDTEIDAASSPLGQNERRKAKGANGEYVVGDTLQLCVTRQVVLNAISILKAANKKVGSYIKFAIRQQMRILPQSPNQLPNENGIQNIFIKYEDYFTERRAELPQKKNKRKKKGEPKKEALKGAPVQKDETPKNEPPPNKKNPLLSYID